MTIPPGASGEIVVSDLRLERDVASVVVDGFEDPDSENLLGGDHGAFSAGGAVAKATTIRGGANGHLRIAFGGTIGAVEPDAEEIFSYAGWETDLRWLDCSRCGSLRLKVRGAEGGERPNLYLDDGNHRWGVDLETYGEVTSEWREFEVPLADIAEYGVDLTHLDALQVLFEWEQQSGAIYIDDIRFGKRPAIASR